MDQLLSTVTLLFIGEAQKTDGSSALKLLMLLEGNLSTRNSMKSQTFL